MKPRPMGSSKAPSAETRVHSITFRISAAPPDPAGQAPARIVTVTGGRSRRPRKPGGPGPPSLRPPRDLYRWEPCRRPDWRTVRSDPGPADPGPGWRPGGVWPARRAVPAPPAAALLSHPRVRSRRGGRAAGNPAVRLAGARRLRGACLGPDVAVPGRHELLPEGATLTTAEPEYGPASALA